jgi:hypothetical protein
MSVSKQKSLITFIKSIGLRFKVITSTVCHQLVRQIIKLIIIIIIIIIIIMMNCPALGVVPVLYPLR